MPESFGHMRTNEWVRMWRDPSLNGLELHHANYITHTFSRHMHDYYVIGVIEDGTQAFSYRGTRHITPSGGVFVIHPGEVHTGEAVGEHGYTYRTLYPDVALFQRAASEIAGYEYSLPFFPTPVIQDAQLTRYVHDLHVALTSGLSPLKSESCFLRTCAYLLTQYAEIHPRMQAPGCERHAIQKICRYIDERYAEKVTLTDLAQLVHLSPYYLMRVFEKEVGISPHAYLESVRIRHAQRLLKLGTPLTQVAYELGFSHQSHFTNRFKRFLGITPGQYLQSRKIVQDKQRASAL